MARYSGCGWRWYQGKYLLGEAAKLLNSRAFTITRYIADAQLRELFVSTWARHYLSADGTGGKRRSRMVISLKRSILLSLISFVENWKYFFFR